MEYLPSLGALSICRTTDGWDLKSIVGKKGAGINGCQDGIGGSRCPAKAKSKINFGNYVEVKTHFGLP